jgi:hypothetical protein
MWAIPNVRHASMVTLLHRVAETFAARSPGRSGAPVPDNQPRRDDSPPSDIAHESELSDDTIRLVILAQCVP